MTYHTHIVAVFSLYLVYVYRSVYPNNFIRIFQQDNRINETGSGIPANHDAAETLFVSISIENHRIRTDFSPKTEINNHRGIPSTDDNTKKKYMTQAPKKCSKARKNNNTIKR